MFPTEVWKILICCLQRLAASPGWYPSWPTRAQPWWACLLRWVLSWQSFSLCLLISLYLFFWQQSCIVNIVPGFLNLSLFPAEAGSFSRLVPELANFRAAMAGMLAALGKVHHFVC